MANHLPSDRAEYGTEQERDAHYAAADRPHAISYEEFVTRFLPMRPKHWDELTESQRESILQGAWEECAWIGTLTDSRLMSAIFARMPMIYR